MTPAPRDDSLLPWSLCVSMVEWFEYKVLFWADITEDKLNEYGLLGWRLAFIIKGFRYPNGAWTGPMAVLEMRTPGVPP